jgi:DNA processing protein
MSDAGSRVLTGDLLPSRLRDLPEPPEKIHLVGEMPRGVGVAVVGTRTPSPEATQFASDLATKLAGLGIVVISGGAEGIDTAAHEGALLGGGLTLVVAPSGYWRPYPVQNAELFARVVAAGGGYLSLHADTVPAEQHFFFARNACLAALSHAVVVVETRVRGGARNAAKWARRLARPLLVVPSAPWIKSGTGAIEELRQGALFCSGLRDVLAELRRTLALPPAEEKRGKRSARHREEDADAAESAQAELEFGADPAPELPHLAPEALQVVRAVRAGARHLDAVCDLSGLPPAVVQSHVLTLTLEGVLVAGPTGALEEIQARRPVSHYNKRE